MGANARVEEGAPKRVPWKNFLMPTTISALGDFEKYTFLELRTTSEPLD